MTHESVGASRGRRQNAPSPRGCWRVAGVTALAVVVSRGILLALLGRMVHGREFTSDVEMHMEMVRQPLYQFLGQLPQHAQHPPLLGLMEAIFAWPLGQVMSDFYAIRIAFLLYEGLMALFLVATLFHLELEPRIRRWVLAGIVVLPMGWMTTVVMAQDEIVGAFFMALVLWLISSGRARAALVTAGFSVVAAKIFLVVPLLALVALLRAGRLPSRVLAAFTPIVVVYLWVYGASVARGGAMGLAGFVPQAYFGCNLWVLLIDAFHISSAVARRVSAALALTGSMAPLVVLFLRRETPSPRSFACLMASMLLWVLVLFYHINPEYYVLCLPPLLIAVRSRWEAAWLVALCTAPWAVNFFYGVQRAMNEAGSAAASNAFVRLYQALFPVPPGIMYLVALWLCIGVTLIAAVEMTRRSLRSATLSS